jgi:hypothetical protein
MRLPRMTTRRWMVIVVVIAACLVPIVLSARSHSYAIRAGYHSLKEAESRWIVEEYEAGRLGFSGRDSVDPLIDRERRLNAYHAALKRKYKLALRRPWLYVEPDPPEPPE